MLPNDLSCSAVHLQQAGAHVFVCILGACAQNYASTNAFEVMTYNAICPVIKTSSGPPQSDWLHMYVCN